jgi:hypothetical protein
MSRDEKRPTRPGFYWARWIKPASGTHEAEELTFPAKDWEVVDVWINHIDWENDPEEGLCVHIPGVREGQWLDCFEWGPMVPPFKQSRGVDQ